MPTPAPAVCPDPLAAPCDRPGCPLRTGPAPEPGPAVILAGRQRELVALLAEGLTSRAIAERLQLWPGTVNASLGLARRRVGARSDAELVTIARRAGAV